METQSLQVIAGFTCSAIFVTSSLPMLLKAFKTKDLKSYSFGHILLSHIGNLLYWIYVVSLPVGPVWFLQGFFTFSTALMLFWYLRYEKGWGRKMIFLEER